MIELPSIDEAEGCIQCQMGSKLVLFITGHCHWMCDYCPLSENRREIDFMYANERRVDIGDWEAVLEEGRAMNATGTGITGGDPMMAAERSIEACHVLKEEFGPSHHIHLYTSIPFKPEVAQQLADAGLDEIRFHLLNLEYGRYVQTMQACRDAGLFVGIEIPCEPDHAERLHELIEEMRGGPALFMNLNELEITVGNFENMEIRGFNLSSEITAGAEGSSELAKELHSKITPEHGFMIKYCTASYKDSGQLRRRFLRRGEHTISPHEQLTEDGTIIFGSIWCEPEDSDNWIAEIQEQTAIPKQFLFYDASTNRLEIPLLLAEEIAGFIEAPVAMVEIHPTHERLEVGLVWLNDIRP
ncbi:MAG: radical SAM protein [Candidatus Thalassarchaeaceae archaeon]|jgi:hypothetical protein|nr:radical SAM protein [Candidatus Thalassarchaeaceae archaeon]